ncbi:MAG: hypothetical protein A2283_24295 [Lentisphaerae bacterium RIFOXYA12_FULL_48_11]|nr:MAG: hypothetical protein A2283_24295 [Lentisphaerae bacterium RIFOXYA12_FULL_48_11]
MPKTNIRVTLGADKKHSCEIIGWVSRALKESKQGHLASEFQLKALAVSADTEKLLEVVKEFVHLE